MAHLTLYLHMIPVVGFQQMVGIGILLQDGRTLRSILHPSLITVVTTETGRLIVIAAITQIVHLQGVTTQEDPTAPLRTGPDILCLRIGRQPETVHVAQTVFTRLHHDTGIILHGHSRLHLLLAPESKALGGNQFTGVTPKRHPVVGRLRLHLPISRKRLGLKPRLVSHGL